MSAWGGRLIYETLQKGVYIMAEPAEALAELERLVAERARLAAALREIIDLPSSREDEGPQIARAALATLEPSVPKTDALAERESGR